MTGEGIPEGTIDARMSKLRQEAEAGGYLLNPDQAFVKNLVAGICVNEQRYGYAACPCRLASGKREDDLDIICPCDYRDPDLNEYGACYCALYVSGELASGKTQVSCIPERRPPRKDRAKKPVVHAGLSRALPLPVWRCRVCGYLCAREAPPLVCPVCKATQDRFEQFL
ncbi:MAG: ferredoxin:glutaredoxin reductase [Methanolinea sp.]|jgi:ferredoxin-thioredoxin reductase catalytic subunit|nr:ferredoxin:glutaredoxin reductase [Methanolinea sp.]